MHPTDAPYKVSSSPTTASPSSLVRTGYPTTVSMQCRNSTYIIWHPFLIIILCYMIYLILFNIIRNQVQVSIRKILSPRLFLGAKVMFPIQQVALHLVLELLYPLVRWSLIWYCNCGHCSSWILDSVTMQVQVVPKTSSLGFTYNRLNIEVDTDMWCKM